MNYYKQGDAANADQIKAAFEARGFIPRMAPIYYGSEHVLFFTDEESYICETSSPWIINIIKTHPDYQELELPIEPKFRVGDAVKTGNTIETIAEVSIVTRSYICESGRTIWFENQDLWHLAPKPHYDISNFHAGMPVLVRWYNTGRWRYSLYSFYEEDSINPFDTVKGSFTQCIPYNNDTKHLLGTTDMPSEEYINW